MTLLLEGKQWSLTLNQGLGQQGGSAHLRPLRPEREAQGSHKQVQTYGWSQVTPPPWKGEETGRSWVEGRGKEEQAFSQLWDLPKTPGTRRGEKNFRWSDSTKDLVIPSMPSFPDGNDKPY